MNSKENEEARFIPIPETFSRRKLNSLYREIPLKDTASRTMRKYFNAMANLYGIIPLRMALATKRNVPRHQTKPLYLYQ